MAMSEKTKHFVSIEDMPTFDASTPVLDVYRRLGEAGRGGFIVDDGKRQRFVNAGDLAARAIIGSRPDARKVMDEAQDSIGSLCERSEAEAAVVTVEDDPVGEDVDFGSLEALLDDKVYAVTIGGRKSGYLFNHDALLDPATKPRYYICANGHRNPDFDHGSCYSCPAEIVGTEGGDDEE